MEKKSVEFMLGELPLIASAIRRLAEKEVPAGTAYRIARIARAVQTELDVFEETRIKLVEKHGSRDEKGQLVRGENSFEFSPGEREVFEAKYQELARTKGSIEVVPISIDELEGLQIAARDLHGFERFIEEGGI